MIDTDTKTGRAAFAAALAAAVIGAGVLAGWFFEVEFLKRLVSGVVAMNPATALAFIFAGTSLELFLQPPFARDRKSRALILAARLCALVVTLAGLARLAGILWGWELGMDQWLFASKLPDGLPFQNRMGTSTALGFVLLGSALLCVDSKNRFIRLWVESSAAVVGFGSVLAILGYAYGLGAIISMALSTAIAFLVLVIATLLSHADSGLLSVLVGESAGGTMARRLLPAAVLVPAILGWIVRQGEMAGIYGGKFAVAVFAIGIILVFAFLICRNARWLFNLDLGRRKAEMALRESEARTRMLVNSSNIGLWDWNLVTKEVFFSMEWKNQLGYTDAELPNRLDEWESRLHPEDRDQMLASVQDYSEGRRPDYEVEFRLRHKDGSWRWILSRARLTRDAAGQPVRMMGCHIDITDRKRSEADLLESNEKFHLLADNITDAFWIRSPDALKVHYISPGFERIWGRSPESLYSSPEKWTDFILPEDRDQVVAVFAGLTGNVPNVDMEYRIFRPSGEIRWVRLRGFQVRDAAGKLIRLTGIVLDITERKQVEAARDRMTAILDSTTDLVGICDPAGHFLYLNPAGRNLLGVDLHEDITSTCIADFLRNPASHPILTEGIPTAVSRGTWSGETVLLSRNGHEFPISEVIIAHRTPDGKVEFLSTIMRDITERKQLEARLFQSQKMETVGKLAGGVAHEFNNIMTAILGQSELLLSDLPPDSPLCTNAMEIHKAVERAAALTRQLLAYGRKQILQPEILDLNSVLAGMESAVCHLMGRGIDVHIVSAADLKAVKADVGQIEQVIVNIATNAADAMPNGGKLSLETANVRFDRDSAGTPSDLKPGDYVMLTITDTGAGMSDEVKTRAFEPFFTTKGVGYGTGLGLSTSYGIISQSGGHISVHSELARGTTFKIYLPQAEQETKIPVRRRDSPDLPGGAETILLVEDDPALREMTTTLLRRLGYTVLAAVDGIEALKPKQQLDLGHIDLLFTDVVMPQMSGEELSERVRELYPNTRILLTTLYTENAIVQQGALNKGVHLLQRPFTPSALARKFREVLDEQCA